MALVQGLLWGHRGLVKIGIQQGAVPDTTRYSGGQGKGVFQQLPLRATVLSGADLEGEPSGLCRGSMGSCTITYDREKNL